MIGSDEGSDTVVIRKPFFKKTIFLDNTDYILRDHAIVISQINTL
tara:strand:+ start:758 stop:892 length:135 start_codon:yes stop_codon:yes gene_type:complete